MRRTVTSEFGRIQDFGGDLSSKRKPGKKKKVQPKPHHTYLPRSLCLDTSNLTGAGRAKLRDDCDRSKGPKAIQAGIDQPATRHLPPRSEHLNFHLCHRIL